MSPCGDSSPVRPCSTTSTVPPSSSATTGLPIAIASQNTRPNGSSCDGITKTSAAASSSSMSSRRPSSATCSATSSSAASRAEILGVRRPADVGADDQQPDVGELVAQTGDGLDDGGRALLREQPADRDQQRCVGRDAEPLARPGRRRCRGASRRRRCRCARRGPAPGRCRRRRGCGRRTRRWRPARRRGPATTAASGPSSWVVPDVDVDDRAGAGEAAEHARRRTRRAAGRWCG